MGSFHGPGGKRKFKGSLRLGIFPSGAIVPSGMRAMAARQSAEVGFNLPGGTSKHAFASERLGVA